MVDFPLFDQNYGLTPLQNPSFSTFIPCIFIVQKDVSSLKNIVKHIFLTYFAYNKNTEKFATFGQNHELSPLENSQFFDFFNLLFLQSRKAFFSFYHIVHLIFVAYFASNRKMEKVQIFDQNHRLTHLEKSQFFNFFNFLFLQSKQAFFSFQDIVQLIFLAYFASNNKWKKFQFGRIMAIFQTSLFRQYGPEKCLLRYSRTKKQPSTL